MATKTRIITSEDTMISQDSAKFWFPKLDACPDPWFRAFLPKTLMIDYDEELLSPALHGKPSKEYDRLYYAVEAAIRYEIAGPAFIRTDITSAKHAGKEAWSVPNEDALNDALLRTLAASQLKTYFQKIKGSAIMVRPLLDIAATRTAFNGLPVGTKEWRVFADQRGVQCTHLYWPEEALTGHMDDGGEAIKLNPGNWVDGWCSTELIVVAKIAARSMGQLKWSIDFAQDKSGHVWLLDMATAGNSYHEPTCKFFGLDNMERI